MSNERVDFSSGQKPEALIKRIINMVSQEDELVLDFKQEHDYKFNTQCVKDKTISKIVIFVV